MKSKFIGFLLPLMVALAVFAGVAEAQHGIGRHSASTKYMPQFTVPDTIYVAYRTGGTACQLNLHWDQLALIQPGMEPCSFTVDCDVGDIKHNCFQWSPASAWLVHDLDIYAIDSHGNRIGSTSTVLKSVAEDTGDGNQHILYIGDSLTTATSYIGEIGNMIDADGGADRDHIGILGANPDEHEGRAGWTLEKYAGYGSNGYAFTVANTVTAVVGDTYTNNSKTFTVVEDRAAWDEVFCTGTGAPEASGDLTKASGTGDATVAFSAAAASGQNPFYDFTNSRLDFRTYAATYSQWWPDVVVITLGINDCLLAADNATTVVDVGTIATNLATIMDALTSTTYGFPHAKIIIAIEPPGGKIDGDASPSSVTFEWISAQNAMNDLARRIIAAYDGEAYDDNVSVCGANLWVDREYGYAAASVIRSVRDDAYGHKVTLQSDSIHPTTTGNNQMADAIYSQFRAFQPILENSVLASEIYYPDATDWLGGASADKWTAVKNASAPDGGSDAYAYHTAADGQWGNIQTDASPITSGAGTYTLSWYAKPYGAGSKFGIRLQCASPATSVYLQYTWSSGAPVYFGSAITTNYGNRLIGDGWYRFYLEVDLTAAQAADAWYVNMFPFEGVNTAGVGNYFWGLQVEQKADGPGGYLETTE